MKLNGTLLNNSCIKEETPREIRKYFELKNNENTTHQNLQDVAKAVLREFIALNAYIRKEEKFGISDLYFQLKNLEKEEQVKPKVIRRR